MSTTYETVLYEVRDEGVALITLNRPDRLNSFGGSMREDIVAAFAAANADPAVRAIVMTGAGKAFCAGGDVKEMSQNLEAGGKRTLKEKIDPARDATLLAIHESTKPVIAAVNGAAVGGGMNLALAADLRVASRGAVFAQSFVKRGLHPDCGGTFFLPRIVGTAKALELMWTGDVIEADEALRLGIVTRVLDPQQVLPEALALAVRIASGPPVAIRLTKRSVYQGVGGTLRDALAREAAAQNVCFETDDAREGALAFVEKRAPAFRGT